MKKNISTFRNLKIRLDDAQGLNDAETCVELSINNNGNGTCGLDLMQGPMGCRLEGDIPMETVRSLATALMAFADLNKI